MRKFKNGQLVQIRGPYVCIGQVCDYKTYFVFGNFYDIVIKKSSLFSTGEIHTVAEEFLDACE